MLDTAYAAELEPALCEVLSRGSGKKRLLEKLAAENSFLYATGDGKYRYHPLFSSFLIKLADEKGLVFRSSQLRAIGKWYYSQEKYYMAAEFFKKYGDYDGIADCIEKISLKASEGMFTIDKMLSLLENAVDENMLRRHPFMYNLMMWRSFLMGDGSGLELYSDLYYANFRRIVLKDPDSCPRWFL